MRQIAFREALREAMQEEMRRDDKVFLMGEEGMVIFEIRNELSYNLFKFFVFDVIISYQTPTLSSKISSTFTTRICR